MQSLTPTESQTFLREMAETMEDYQKYRDLLDELETAPLNFAPDFASIGEDIVTIDELAEMFNAGE